MTEIARVGLQRLLFVSAWLLKGPGDRLQGHLLQPLPSLDRPAETGRGVLATPVASQQKPNAGAWLRRSLAHAVSSSLCWCLQRQAEFQGSLSGCATELSVLLRSLRLLQVQISQLLPFPAHSVPCWGGRARYPETCFGDGTASPPLASGPAVEQAMPSEQRHPSGALQPRASLQG